MSDQPELLPPSAQDVLDAIVVQRDAALASSIDQYVLRMKAVRELEAVRAELKLLKGE